MLIHFAELIPAPAAEVYQYFRTPADWGRLYGFAGQVQDRGGGWHAVPLKHFPFPLVARVTNAEPPRLVQWQFKGFWRGRGEVRLTTRPGGTLVEGFEEISIRWLPGVSWLLERLFMEREFRRTWALGWSRLRSERRGSSVRVALANLRVPATPAESVALATAAVAEAGRQGALVVCFPECFVPGYRWPDTTAPPPDPAFLERAWAEVADAARAAGITVILGTERVTERGLQITACVFNPDGTIAGWQDKGQLDPDEEAIYPAFGSERRVFTAGPLTFGVVICHEGWRYPETVRWAVRRGAQVVFHPHAHVALPGSYRPVSFADPANTFHEKAILCRAAENTCYVASVNCASEGSGTTSAIASPDGTLLCFQPYGREGLLVADLDLSAATGNLALRCRTEGM